MAASASSKSESELSAVKIRSRALRANLEHGETLQESLSLKLCKKNLENEDLEEELLELREKGKQLEMEIERRKERVDETVDIIHAKSWPLVLVGHR